MGPMKKHELHLQTAGSLHPFLQLLFADGREIVRIKIGLNSSPFQHILQFKQSANQKSTKRTRTITTTTTTTTSTTTAATATSTNQ
jgi:hypothetical protein